MLYISTANISPAFRIVMGEFLQRKSSENRFSRDHPDSSEPPSLCRTESLSPFILFFTLVRCCSVSVISPGLSFSDPASHIPGNKSSRKGFVRYDSEFEGRALRLVCPEIPLHRLGCRHCRGCGIRCRDNRVLR